MSFSGLKSLSSFLDMIYTVSALQMRLLLLLLLLLLLCVRVRDWRHTCDVVTKGCSIFSSFCFLFFFFLFHFTTKIYTRLSSLETSVVELKLTQRAEYLSSCSIICFRDLTYLKQVSDFLLKRDKRTCT